MIDFCALRVLTSDLQDVEAQLVASCGLTFPQASVLCAVESGYGDPGSLAVQMKLSPSRLTRITDALEKRGLISRATSEKDRRSVRIALTDEGRKRLEEIHRGSISLPSYIEKMIAGKGKEERK